MEGEGNETSFLPNATLINSGRAALTWEGVLMLFLMCALKHTVLQSEMCSGT